MSRLSKSGARQYRFSMERVERKSFSEFRSVLGQDLVSSVFEKDRRIILTKYGKDMAVVISMADYQKFLTYNDAAELAELKLMSGKESDTK